ncbi:MAG TPA: Ig-like domain-containing protein, partial [Spirochaetota bacterium]|nr:Ig-like domain-containing protein [Spirochaetota bacterium]
VVVEFSKSMDTIKTSNEFSLSSGSEKIEGIFAWEDGNRKLVFTPRTHLASDKFTVRVTDAAEDTEGNDLKNEFVSNFFISGETGSPSVLSYSPLENTAGNLPDSRIAITFSEPVDLNSIYNGISISPSIEGTFLWNAGVSDSTVITFNPIYGFNYGVTYTVTVSDSILDVSGNKLREPVSFNFTVGDDFVKPELHVYQDDATPLNFDEAVYTHGAEKDKRIVLRFTEIIKTDNLRSAITISPSALFYVSSEVQSGATTAYINFSENLESEEIYTLRISSSITDTQANPLIKDYRYVFVTDGIYSIAPNADTIGDLAAPLPPALPKWIKNEIQILQIQAAHPLLYSDIIIDFTSEIDPLSLSIYAETVSGTGGSPSIVNIDWPDSPPAKFTRLKFGLYNVHSGNIYMIVLKGGKNGLRDMNGNYMKLDFEQMVRF